ncbi:hypothetical protein K491DRAFT_721365 [Lophiostoma macrostomum CBS 122681]|uniref:Rhodopsin domain-containing protein n=1 Tax=Lophiostoma macrostomum CBS 122681 TaxID=1314788 RepID=A0A6A6ST79_9PLEO|nr:hypothetical protein K491DRAFT_721365 [Lophiostoma macrostomum CBS 122681]
MEIPLRLPPTGVSSNFVKPAFLGLPVLIVAGICLPLVLLFAAIHIYAKVKVSKRWRLFDYVYMLAWALGVAMITLPVTLVFSSVHGYHAWDIPRSTVSKSSVMSLLAFWVALGPLFWLLKIILSFFILTYFGSVRWAKNCAWVGIIATGLVFSAYPIVVTMTCGPRAGSDVESYIDGLDHVQCTSSSGANAISSDVTSILNAASNLYLLLIVYPLVPTLTLTRNEMRGVYGIYSTGAFVFICSLLGVYFRIRSWLSVDITGNQVPVYAIVIVETTLTLIIPCIPSLWSVYRFLTVPDIDDTTTLATPNMKLLSSVGSPVGDQRSTWRKTHMDIEEIPYKRTSSQYTNPQDLRMKALPVTPLPFAPTVPPSPKTASPLSPSSSRSMSLPIMFHEIPNR